MDDAINLVKRAIAHHHEQQKTSTPVLAVTKGVDIIGESPAMQEVFRAVVSVICESCIISNEKEL